MQVRYVLAHRRYLGWPSRDRLPRRMSPHRRRMRRDNHLREKLGTVSAVHRPSSWLWLPPTKSCTLARLHPEVAHPEVA